MEKKNEIIYTVDDKGLKAEEFLLLADKIWPGNYNEQKTQQALSNTINITARNDKGALLGCVRVLTDGYYFSTIPEILVLPAHQKQGIGKRLMELAFEASPASLFFGAQAGNEGFFEKLGYEKSMQSYGKKKKRKA